MKSKQRVWLVLAYVGLLYLGLYLAVILRYGGQLEAAQQLAHYESFTPVFLLWLAVFFIHGLFDVQVFRRYTSLVFNLVSATAVNFLVATTYFYFQPNLILTPRRFLVIDVGVTFFLLLSWDLLVKYFIKNRLIQDVYLFSFNLESDELKREIENNSYLGYRVAGQLNEQNLPAGVGKNALIILPNNLNSNPKTSQALYNLRVHGVTFFNRKDFYESLTRKIYLSELSELWFLENIDYREKRFYNMFKRVIDFFVGVLSGVVFLVTFPIIGLLIKLTTRGPIFFVQERTGKNGKTFKVYKYRTMDPAKPTNTWTSVNDPRITKVGKFLRKARVDEWPQFINLMLGSMSLVGPRPEQPHIVDELKQQIPFYEERLLVKPGLTGWAQINNIYAGNVEETKLKLQFDLYYIKHRGLLFDLEIILKTLYYIFTWQGR